MGTLLALAPMLIVLVLVVFGAVLAATGYVGLSTMSAATSLPLWLAVTRLPEDQPLFIYLAVMAVCVIYWHRSNIERMLAGNENRNTRVMLFKPKDAPPVNDDT